LLTAVEITSVAKGYGSTLVLDDVNIRFEEGTFTSLLGPSGSGKTTLLRIVAGFVTPDRGDVTIGGKTVTATPVWARNIGMVFQSYALFPHMSVADNVAFGLNRRGIRGAAAKREVDRALELVRLEAFGQRRPKQLSGGQQQRVALARAIVTRPSVLLLDEPLSALDRRLRQEMQVELLRIQRESGLTTIFVTHDQEEALTLSDKVAILDRGRIVQYGEPSVIYERPRTRFAAEFLGDTNFLTGRATGHGVEVEGRSIRIADPLPPQGQEAVIAVRPEKMTIAAPDVAGHEAENRLGAVIRTVIYAGAASTYLLETHDGLPLKVFMQNRENTPFAVGMEVAVTWSPAHSILIEA
jgi:spermidine/putrescine transport system ATP-binding protein